jgi:dTDP-4-amino-4,6-dideoxygalactose transaminase
MHINFLDLHAQYNSLKSEIDTAICDVFNSCAFAGGRFVAEFETSFAAYCQCQHVIGLGSGSEALWISLVALGVGPNCEVITVPNSFLATAEAITLSGAKPVFIDIDPVTYTLDVSKLEEAITPKTRAIIPVHIYGQVSDMDPIMQIAKKHGLSVIEDACQAHGAYYKGKKAGSIGDVGCFSFYPGKNLGAYGEAGAVITNNPDIEKKMRMFRDHGQSKKYYHDFVGWNGRMDGIQGAILNVKLRYLDAWNNARRNIAKLYNESLVRINGLTLPVEASYGNHVYHVYAVCTRERDSLYNELEAKGIQCGIHYPIPIHLQKAYKYLNYSIGSFPIAEKLAKGTLSLPIYAELSNNQIDYVIENILLFYCKNI